jgi:hypothetical protein
MPEPVTAITKSITILVNRREVEMPDRDATGAEIKGAAGVPADFQLFEQKGNKLIPIGDGDTIKLHNKQKFTAVSGQDVS